MQAQKVQTVNPTIVCQTQDFGFSAATIAEHLVFTSGQVGWNDRYEFSEKHYPASTLLGIEKLARPELLIEIEGIARQKNK